jgi:hypothetical protein
VVLGKGSGLKEGRGLGEGQWAGKSDGLGEGQRPRRRAVIDGRAMAWPWGKRSGLWEG